MDNSDVRKYAVCALIVDHIKTAVWRDGNFYILRHSSCDWHCDDCVFQLDCESITEGPRLCEILFGKQFPGFSIGIL